MTALQKGSHCVTALYGEVRCRVYAIDILIFGACDRHTIGEVWRMAYATGMAKSDIDGVPDTNKSPTPGRMKINMA